MSSSNTALVRDLRRLVGDAAVADEVPSAYLADATESRGITGWAEALALPSTPEDVQAIVAWCYRAGIPIVPRGGGTGFTGGAVPFGGVLISLERLRRVRTFDPLLWRAEVEAGRTTADVRRLARENGLLFPPDPGAAEQSQLGGNIATNAGGPHAFKYGVTGHWVTGIEAVVAPGELLRVGGAHRKDVAGYDLKSLLVGSEGTLGIVTSAWLRFVPAPAATAVVISLHESVESGCAAIERVLGNGVPAAALEFLDPETVAVAGAAFPGGLPAPGFMVIAEVDGSQHDVEQYRAELLEVLGEDAISVRSPLDPVETQALWRWRDGVSIAVEAAAGGKVSEDIVVSVDRLAEAIEGTLDIGRRHELRACSWGHAGDGNLHSTFMISAEAEHDLTSAHDAAVALFTLAATLGGSISGEHGVGWVKNGHLVDQWSEVGIVLHEAIKQSFDPKNLLNPGKKIARGASVTTPRERDVVP